MLCVTVFTVSSGVVIDVQRWCRNSACLFAYFLLWGDVVEMSTDVKLHEMCNIYLSVNSFIYKFYSSAGSKPITTEACLNDKKKLEDVKCMF